MNKPKQLLNALNKNHEIRKIYTELLQVLLNYFEIYDLANYKNHKNIFTCIYIDHNSYLFTAMKCNVSKATIERYVKDYNELAKRVIINKSGFEKIKRFLFK